MHVCVAVVWRLFASVEGAAVRSSEYTTWRSCEMRIFLFHQV